MSFPRLFIGFVFLSCALGLSGKAQQPPKEDPLAFRGKTASEWREQLANSPLSKDRAVAAEALGYIARSTRLTHGGFSDVPIDSPEPPMLDAATLEPIVSALRNS